MRGIKAVGSALLAAFFLAPPAIASGADLQFAVKATLQNPNNSAANTSGFCVGNSGLSGFGATITVVCSTGAVVDVLAGSWFAGSDSGYRQLFQISNGGQVLGAIDSYSGAGSTTSVQVINSAGNSYVEMQVGW